MRVRRNQITLAFILLLLGLGVATLAFRTIDLGGFERGSPNTVMGLKLGLDLQGGTSLTYRADDPGVTSAQMQGVAEIIERRVNSFGVSEALVQLKGQNEVIIQLPGVSDLDQAKRLIGGTAQLDFRECADPTCSSWAPAIAQGSGGVNKHLTGKFLRPVSAVGSDPQTGLPLVSFEFNREGANMFEQITQRNIQRPVGIFLDNQLISSPTVQSVISSTGQITGLTTQDAKLLAIQLNAGALPVAIKVVREQDVSATLGQDSLDKSYLAAAIGLGLVALFMLLYYRMLGLVAVASIFVYSVIVLAIFKLMGVTLTLSGIAGFVISIGIAVDANVIIFERMREELRNGRSLGAAIETGFDRAWNAIRDSNITTIIAMAILWWFGDQLGEPRVIGFAITLVIGVAVSMFSAITVSRTLLRLFVGTGLADKTGLFVNVKAQAAAARPVFTS